MQILRSGKGMKMGFFGKYCRMTSDLTDDEKRDGIPRNGGKKRDSIRLNEGRKAGWHPTQ